MSVDYGCVIARMYHARYMTLCRICLMNSDHSDSWERIAYARFGTPDNGGAVD